MKHILLLLPVFIHILHFHMLFKTNIYLKLSIEHPNINPIKSNIYPDITPSFKGRPKIFIIHVCRNLIMHFFVGISYIFCVITIRLIKFKYHIFVSSFLSSFFYKNKKTHIQIKIAKGYNRCGCWVFIVMCFCVFFFQILFISYKKKKKLHTIWTEHTMQLKAISFICENKIIIISNSNTCFHNLNTYTYKYA